MKFLLDLCNFFDIALCDPGKFQLLFFFVKVLDDTKVLVYKLLYAELVQSGSLIVRDPLVQRD